MKKISASYLIVTFVLFITANVYSTEKALKHFKYSKPSPFSISKFNEEFSLKKNYEIEIKKINHPFFELEKLGKELNLQQVGHDPRIDFLQIEIKKLKKKKTGYLIGSIAFAGLGGFLIYKYATYEAQEGQIRTRAFVGRRRFTFPILTSLGISAVLLNGSIQARKKIKSYEIELKKLSDAEKKQTNKIK